MGQLVGGSTTTSSGSSSGGALPSVVLSTSAITPTTTYSADTALAQSVTGKRFAIEYMWINTNSGSSSVVGCGLGWSGATLNGMGVYMEYPSNNASGTMSRLYSVTQSVTTTSPYLPTAATGVSGGAVRLLGYLDFTTSATVTLTPWISANQGFAMPSRYFSVTTIA